MKKNYKFIATIFIFLSLGCIGSIQTDKEIINKPMVSVIEIYGQEYKEIDLHITEEFTSYEYRNNLKYLFDSLKTGDTIIVKELFWEYSWKNIVVWFIEEDEKWVSIDHLSWTKDINF